MNNKQNKFGESQTTWQSHIHPKNINFMQIVKYMHIHYPDGRNNLFWSLQGASENDKHIIPNITLEKAIQLYTDNQSNEVDEVTEEMFEEWLKSK